MTPDLERIGRIKKHQTTRHLNLWGSLKVLGAIHLLRSHRGGDGGLKNFPKLRTAVLIGCMKCQLRRREGATLREIFEKVGISDDLGLSQNSELLLHFF